MCDKISYESREALESYDDVISYQKKEILKTQELIYRFKDNLFKQKESLQMFLEEEKLLTDKKVELLTQHQEKNEQFDDALKEISSLTESNREKIKINMLDASQRSKEKNLDLILKRSGVHQVVEESALKMNILKVADVDDRVVSDILHFGGHVFICGSKGMLMKQSSNKTHIFNTNTEKDILQIQVVKFAMNISLIAFTNETIMVYKTINDSAAHRVIKLAEIGCVSSDDNFIYIPVKGGMVKTLNKQNFAIKSLISLPLYDIRSFVVSASKRLINFFSSRHGLLYSLDKSPEQKVESVKEIENVKKVINVESEYILCYSEDTMWALDFKLIDCGKKIFENGIKLVETFKSFVAVVDNNDTLFVYDLNRNNFFKEDNTVFSTKISKKVTAATMSTKNVFLYVGKEIFLVSYQL